MSDDYEVRVPAVTDDTFGDKMDNITLMLAAIAEANSDHEHGQGIYFKNFKTLQQLNRMGLAKMVLDSYSQIIVNRETGMTVAVHGGITAATVNETTFVEKVGEAETKEYEFVYDGSAWHLGSDTVILSEYGIAVTGTPAADDTVVVHETAAAVTYDVLGIDHDVPSDPNFTHTITLCRHDGAHYSALAYKKPQGIIWVDPSVFPNGFTAGETYYVVGNCMCYDGTNKQDGTYGFVPPHNVPADGLIRHTTMGSWYGSAADYTKQKIIDGKWVTYGPRSTGRQQIDANIETLDLDGTTGTNLGTITAEDYSKRVETYLNLTRRNYYGSNNYLGSDERAWMRSNAAKGQTNGIYDWQGTLGEFDLPSTYNAAGNLNGMDPSLLEVIGAVKKRTYLHAVDRTNQSVKYADSDETVFPLSMCEVGLGETNDGVYENTVDRNGNPKTTPYEYFARRTTDAERIKYVAGIARHWWLRSPYPWGCGSVRSVYSSGALYSYNAAGDAYAAVDAYNIV